MDKHRHNMVVVNRKWLTDLADRIYNPKTGEFLRLCYGRLQNGPDPTDKRRPMHCGLGELYFAMTGDQPEDTPFVVEEDVVDTAVELSELSHFAQKLVKKAEISLSKNIEAYVQGQVAACRQSAP